MTTAFCVTLVFAPPGPLHSSMLLAPDRETAVALATMAAAEVAGEYQLAGVACFPVPEETLRRMLRAVEGRGPGEVVSLVTPEQRARDQRAGEMLREAPTAHKPCRHYPDYPNCTCDPVSCVMLRSTANPAGLESLTGGTLGGGSIDRCDAMDMVFGSSPKDPAA